MTKVSDLPADNAPSSDDYIVVNDSTSGQTKKVLLSDLITLTYANYPATAWASWTPSWTNFTPSAATITAKYIQIGKTIHFSLIVTLSGSTVSGVIGFSPPATLASYYPADTIITSNVKLLDTGISLNHGMITVGSSTRLDFYAANSSSTYITRTGTSSTVPHTWGNADVFSAFGTYESA